MLRKVHKVKKIMSTIRNVANLEVEEKNLKNGLIMNALSLENKSEMQENLNIINHLLAYCELPGEVIRYSFKQNMFNAIEK